MTNETELRDRLVATIDKAAVAWQNSRDQRDELHAIAQAIIDEFGLTVEEQLTGLGTDPGFRLRVAGKWGRI